jgi:CrcB protein
MTKWFSFIITSLLGAFARYYLATFVYKKLGTGFPYGTLLVNLSGCLAIGFFNSLAESRMLLSPIERLALMTGFCGAFTTFSSFLLETSNLLKLGEWGLGVSNVAVSVTVGLIFLRLGETLGRLI